jgi:hypothetical protein
MREMMQKAGKITRLHRALKVELEDRPDTLLVIGAADVPDLLAHGAAATVFQITRSADVDVVEVAGSAYGTRTGKGIALRIDVGVPVLPVLFASRAQVRDTYDGLRTAAVISAPADDFPRDEEKKRRIDGDAANPPRKRDIAPVVIAS